MRNYSRLNLCLLFAVFHMLAGSRMVRFKSSCGVFQHWEVFKEISEVFILVPALVGLKGNLEMTLASRLSTAVSGNPFTPTYI